MFSTLQLRFSTLLYSVNRLSRVIRRHMRHVVETLEKEEGVFTKAKESAQLGHATDVLKDLKELEKLLQIDAQEMLLDDVQKLEAAELKIESDLDDPMKLLKAIEHRIRSASVPGTEELLHRIAELEKKLQGEMYARILKDLQVEFFSANAMARANAGGDEHKYLAEKRGITRVMLANAMRDVYKIRVDKRGIAKSLGAFKDLDKHLEKDIQHLHDAHANLPQLIQKLFKEEEELEKVAAELIQEVDTLFDRFASIFRVFATYFFMIFEDEKLLKTFLEELKKIGYPTRYTEEIQNKIVLEDHNIEHIVQKVVDVLARMRHVPQEALG